MLESRRYALRDFANWGGIVPRGTDGFVRMFMGFGLRPSAGHRAALLCAWPQMT